jgi:hypothetical protein
MFLPKVVEENLKIVLKLQLKTLQRDTHTHNTIINVQQGCRIALHFVHNKKEERFISPTFRKKSLSVLSHLLGISSNL